MAVTIVIIRRRYRRVRATTGGWTGAVLRRFISPPAWGPTGYPVSFATVKTRRARTHRLCVHCHSPVPRRIRPADAPDFRPFRRPRALSPHHHQAMDARPSAISCPRQTQSQAVAHQRFQTLLHSIQASHCRPRRTATTYRLPRIMMGGLYHLRGRYARRHLSRTASFRVVISTGPRMNMDAPPRCPPQASLHARRMAIARIRTPLRLHHSRRFRPSRRASCLGATRLGHLHRLSTLLAPTGHQVHLVGVRVRHRHMRLHWTTSRKRSSSSRCLKSLNRLWLRSRIALVALQFWREL